MNPCTRRRWPWLTLLIVLSFLVPMPVLAEQAQRDVLDGDLADAAAGGPRDKTWLTVSAFTHAYEQLGQRDVGAMALVGIALDRIAARDGERSLVEVQATDAVGGHAAPPRLPLSRDVARLAVTAAWRVSGLGPDDARLDSIVSRARWSALLPETRLRASRLLDDRTNDTSAATSLSTRQNLGLEARLTWRFDRLLYAAEETSIERVRVDRGEARVRVATRVLSALALWQRAWVEGRRAAPDSTDAFDCALRASEAEATLDVLTAGWFSSWRARAVPE